MMRVFGIIALMFGLNTALLAQGAMGGDPAPSAASADPMPDDSALTQKKPKYDSNDPAFRDVAKEFRCPTCTGLSVLESDAGFSVQIKDQVQEQLNLGKNHDQIVEYFVTRYGPWILREPPVKGINAFAWIIPIALLVLGPIAIWILVWKRRVKADSHGVRSSTVILREMQDSLQRLKGEKV